LSKVILLIILVLKTIYLITSPVSMGCLEITSIIVTYHLKRNNGSETCRLLRNYLSDGFYHGFRQRPTVADARHATIAYHIKPRHKRENPDT
jgi:hypothetical protein